MNREVLATVLAFLIWGMMPLYLHPLARVSIFEIMSHRVVWSCVLLTSLLALRRELTPVWRAIRTPSVSLPLVCTAFLISVNWLVFVWAVGQHRVVEASLGYFINPLINVLLGVIVVRERLNRVQWSAVALAAGGVAYLTWWNGAAPWIALALGVTFSLYGLVRKLAAVEAVTGLTVETILLTPMAAAYLVWVHANGGGAFGHAGTAISVLLLAGGLITAIPLALFSYGARRLPYSTVGLIQYIGPTIQLVLGIVLYDEPFTAGHAIGFILIWVALALYAGDGLWRTRRIS